MKFTGQNVILAITLCTVVTRCVWAEAKWTTDTDTESLSHLVEAVERLRSKEIPQAYFWLQSPQVPNSAIFFPDTKGGAFILIARVMKLPRGANAESALAEIRKSWPESELPILDAENNRLLYYSDDAWIFLEETLRPWVTATENVKGLAAANQWEINDGDLFIKIPLENSTALYTALMKAWKTSKDDFRCFAGWN
jgi:hypothetical protein